MASRDTRRRLASERGTRWVSARHVDASAVGEALALAALVLFSTSVLLVRAASTRLGQSLGFLVALLANVVGAALFFVGRLLLSDAEFHIDRDAVLLFAAAGLFANYLGRRGFFASVVSLGPSRASAIQTSVPVLAGAVAWPTLGEAIGLHDAAAVGLVIVGLGFTVSRRGTSKVRRVEPASESRRLDHRLLRVVDPRGHAFLAMMSAMSYAVGNVLRAAGIDRWDEPAFGGLVGATAGTAAYWVAHAPARRLVRKLSSASRAGIVLWTCSGTVTISAQIAQIAATGYLPVAVVLAISSALPLVVVPVSVILLRDRAALTRRTTAGTLLVLCGVALFLLT